MTEDADLHERIRAALLDTDGIRALASRAGFGGWGPWRLDPDTRVLYPIEPYRYEVDLDTCTTSAEVLDWICQIADKNWADDATLAGFVRALNDVLHPQANLCPWGKSKRFTVSQIARRVASVVAEANRNQDAS